MKKHKITIEKGQQKPLFSFIKVIRRCANATLDKLGADLPCAIDVSLVSPDEIKEINSRERQIDAVTDVLSFPQLDIHPGDKLSEVADPYDMVGTRVLLGDVVLCYPKALKQAIEYNHSYNREIGFLTVHSVLHLLGYDHMTPEDEKLMFGLTEEILTKLKLTR